MFVWVAVATAILSLATASRGSAQKAVELLDNFPSEALTNTPIGPANPDLRLSMEVVMALRNSNALDQLLADQQDPASSQYEKWITPQQFAARFGPSQKECDGVRDWLQSQGFVVTKVDRPNRSISFTGRVATAKKAFDTPIMAFGNGPVYANTRGPMIPAQFAGVIGAINGLDNMRKAVPMTIHPRLRTISRAQAASKLGLHTVTYTDESIDLGEALPTDSNPRSRAQPNATIGGATAFAPGDFRTFYHELATPDGTGSTCIAIVGDSDFLTTAVNLFNTQFALPNTLPTPFLASGTNPGKNGDEIEALLDIEWSHAVAPKATQRYYLGDPSKGGITDSMKAVVSQNACSIMSISFGSCGKNASWYTQTLDPIFKQAASQGISVFVSSGDKGAAGLVFDPTSNNCVAGTTRNVNEMSADPNVTSVGGTGFHAKFNSSGNDVGFVAERVWNDSGGSTGGGLSSYFAKPSYQTGPGVLADGTRDVPDVSILASGVLPGVFFGTDKSGTAEIDIQGGTSLSAPVWAGITKLAAQKKGVARLGNINPKVYSIAAVNQATAGFRDVTGGNNSFNGVLGFSATPGWDLATGWGTPDINKFITAFAAPPVRWPMFHHDLRHTGLSQFSTAADTGTPQWEFITSGWVFSSPAIANDGTIYVGSDDNNLYAINPDGTKKWKFPTHYYSVQSSPAIGSDGTIYVGSDDGNLYAINPNGAKKWNFPTGNAIESSPAIGADGTIYVGSNENNLYAIDPNGAQKWYLDIGYSGKSSPAIGADGTIYIGSPDGNLYAINPNGSQRWKFPAEISQSSPAIGADGTIYIGSQNGNLYAVNPNGSEKWEFSPGYHYVQCSPAIGSDATIYVGSDDGNLYAINPNGTEKWNLPTGNSIASSPAIGADGTIYVGSNDNNLYAINPNGTKRWKVLTGSIVESSPAIGADGTIYVGSSDGNLYAIK
ncbi:MAG: PQQ-binding-like beta-propeller repeat protein [Candidatus Binataceae bacterium]